MNTFIDADAAKLAGLQMDLLKKMREKKISLESLEQFVRGELAPTERSAIVQAPPAKVQVVAMAFTPFDRQLQEQEDFFKKYFGFKLDLGGVKIPQHKEGFDRLIIVPRELAEPWKTGNAKSRVQPLNWLYSVCEANFKCWRYANNLDAAIPNHDRHPQNGTYALLVRDRVEADEENKNLPARHFWDNKLSTEGIIERILHELKCWDESGNHLDVKNYTLCPASRYSGGGVPDAYLHGREFCVGCASPVGRGGGWRARSAELSSS
ncbi:MAG: hypothetical protein A3C50_03705 [Candidatus Staskawiczbacteria bacterium RIFCSPHIGHO2_02_FULL_43_16]|uniref:Uncharacterized protein n=1 Tax=Candidatus Staskawiczbacteria bacterium RIFCSPHIGHO2_01_FULL_41_41 TaxID=1802203 RepID=A0A1G2HU66_9BACT|nr:MAG: hypothetical protein A2822_02810 [Candidatus Staskawiczbacteria bacterium RIFCSPHIGHO2_01_FULL_41_41]OGZ68041.1 MAG: hypothetical protein A3C50_03705 [Candidatus Staskawiczbacteria bacterium RIFCSPHIGHO2_02_FULL_43_16]OGZ74777.1 MAG: hypothetical protein A3A12_02890 [Candidatus Staskawiczbacteria bacterium RIFCSPLOWO2_01_FULL_43_17b]